MGIIRRIKKYDTFAKTMNDFQTRTTAGGIFSLACISLAVVLSMFVIAEYSTVDFIPSLKIDDTDSSYMPVKFNITFHKMPCFAIFTDIMDVTYDHQINITKNIQKTRLTADGKKIPNETEPPKWIPEGTTDSKCGRCYMATIPKDGKIPCCETCEDVLNAYREHNLSFPLNISDIIQCSQKIWDKKIEGHKQEGCNLVGDLNIHKVAGNIHFAPGIGFQLDMTHVHDVRPLINLSLDFTHTIHSLSFGTHHENLMYPLDAVNRRSTTKDQLFTYLIKIVPTIFKMGNQVIETNQFSASYSHISAASSQEVPGLYFNLDISPLLVIYEARRMSMATFLSRIFGIVGGVYTVAGALDSLFYSLENRLFLKNSIGKQS